jgi:hypothetical protein
MFVQRCDGGTGVEAHAIEDRYFGDTPTHSRAQVCTCYRDLRFPAHMGKLFVSKECNGTAFVVERPVYIN